MTTTKIQRPETIRLADALKRRTPFLYGSSTIDHVEKELRRQDAEIERLTAENEALKEKVAGCDIMGLAEEQRQLRGPFHGIGTPNRAMFD